MLCRLDHGVPFTDALAGIAAAITTIAELPMPEPGGNAQDLLHAMQAASQAHEAVGIRLQSERNRLLTAAQSTERLDKALAAYGRQAMPEPRFHDARG